MSFTKTSNSKLAESFSNGATEGQGSNMLIENDTIYSYGHHFKIAIRLNPDQRIATGIGYVYNPNRYSSTTNKHQALVRYAIGHDFVAIPDCNIEEQFLRGYIQELKDDLEKELKDLREKQGKLTTKGKRFEQYENKIARTQVEMTNRIKEVESFTVALYGGQAIHFIKNSA